MPNSVSDEALDQYGSNDQFAVALDHEPTAVDEDAEQIEQDHAGSPSQRQCITKTRIWTGVLVASMVILLVAIAILLFWSRDRNEAGADQPAPGPGRGQTASLMSPLKQDVQTPTPTVSVPDSPLSVAAAAVPTASSAVPTASSAMAVAAEPEPDGTSQTDADIGDTRVPVADPAATAKPVITPGNPIIVDDADNEALILQPPGAWGPSTETRRSYASSSRIARVDGTVYTATFVADIPESGTYELFLYWINSGASFRFNAVPVTIHAAAGAVRMTVDQVRSGTAFQSIGKFQLREGTRLPVITMTTEGVPAGPSTMYVSVDALKLVRVAD